MNRIQDIEHRDGYRKIVFEHHWREGFLGEALTIRVSLGGQVSWMEFYSSEHGVVQWCAGEGLRESHSWEAELTHELAGKDSRFPVYLLNGVASGEVSEQIVGSVLAHRVFAELRPELLTHCHEQGCFQLPTALS